jgi:hypothetical protein
LRYRERHAKRRADVRKVTNILMRQTRDAGDIYRLATALRAILTARDIAELRRELRS